MPNQLIYESRTTRSKKSLKRGPLVIAAALLVIAVAAGWALWEIEHEVKPSKQELQLLHDAEQLWSWSDTLLMNGATAAAWRVRWDIQVKPEQVQPLTDMLFRDQTGEPLSKVSDDNGRRIQGRIGASGEQLTVQVIEMNDITANLMILYSAEEEALKDWNVMDYQLVRISRTLADMASQVTSSIHVMGRTASTNAIKAFSTQSQSEEIDRYEEGGTISVTLYSPLLQQAVRMEPKSLRANVQIAAHQPTDDGPKLLTIGIPLINGDYSSVFD